jgi:hypothetical protein
MQFALIHPTQGTQAADQALLTQFALTQPTQGTQAANQALPTQSALKQPTHKGHRQLIKRCRRNLH